MDMIGIDLHKRESQLCIRDAEGHATERRIVTSRDRFTAVLGSRPPARILVEASTQSEWVACHLESLGHAVVVADPNFAPMYATRSRRVKTDKREALVRTRTRCIALATALVRRDGLRVPSSTTAYFVERLTALPLSPTLQAELAPLVAVLAPLNVQIEAADVRIAALGRTDPIVALLRTAPSVGPVTASGLVAIADDIGRFPSAHQFEAFLGLVPGERSSGEKRRLGHITKAGNRRARYLLVEAAWRIRRSKSADTAVLRAWAQRILHRRGKKIAAVALARRLAGVLYAMWRDQRVYDAGHLRMSPTAPAHAA